MKRIFIILVIVFFIKYPDIFKLFIHFLNNIYFSFINLIHTL